MELRFGVAAAALPALLGGAGVTLAVSLLAVALGILVGIALTLAQQSGLRPLRWACRAYVSLMRGTPLFIQVLIVFYLLPATGIDLSPFLAGTVALSLNSGAYVTEIIRAGLHAVPRGQVEAARAHGMPRALVWRRVVLPQALTAALPPLAVEFTSLLKASALLSVIAVVELTRVTQQVIAATFRPIELWLTTGAIYFCLCFVLGRVTRRLERRAAARA